jgi:hypothetical protein
MKPQTQSLKKGVQSLDRGTVGAAIDEGGAKVTLEGRNHNSGVLVESARGVDPIAVGAQIPLQSHDGAAGVA